ncbi:MAG: glycosyltransferase family 4 protein, partial [Pyrinomonadaceae bacterium]
FSPAMTGYIFAALPPLVAAKIYGKKVILNYHSGELEAHLKRWKRLALPTMRKFDEVIVPSQFLVAVFAKFGLKSKAVFNFIDTEKFVFRTRNPLRPIFLSNRNFEMHYNVGGVLRAFQLIQKQIPEAALIVAGGGREEAELEKTAADLRLENVEFVGRVEQAEMPKIYDRADIFLNASIVDNMPLSLLEAFACGLPVISSNAGGIPYLVKNGETGILVEKNDDKSLALQALGLLENNERAQKIIRRALNESQKYTAAKVLEEWRDIFSGEHKL